jgi:NADH-quinone oxidoreductase subunit C
MERSFITGKLKTRFTGDILAADEKGDMLTVLVDRKIVHEVIRFLKENDALGFTFLTTLCGIHYPEQELPLGVVYHLHRIKDDTRIRVKTFLPLADPVVPTVTDLFSAANWMERETFDFYGIVFEGHPNLKRILNVEYLDFFPLRKEYPLEDPTQEDKDNRFFGR